ncbi:hypothetical protein [Methylobacterium haplocladii]|uniref:Uncharacterized protein n=1 Tax=Methylobacterium haplocladii TaxID=1176176 RepID=A0A512IS44_9HYPH|nr:hypothetical protein [Methylobacterium haplocladii]GEP00511.1 hypothetical protein MHA02_28980 [Methylobacterium haplocladii]GJD85426.1 hypothetical protein HPGCJGGD_3315 [Methylobacterium haplocladii]GLS57811.1 hypothetical protein GCM10007887_04670 [Methylobacterium haplocladii]
MSTNTVAPGRTSLSASMQTPTTKPLDPASGAEALREVEPTVEFMRVKNNTSLVGPVVEQSEGSITIVVATTEEVTRVPEAFEPVPAPRPLTEAESFMVNAAVFHGFEHLDEYATIYVASPAAIVALVSAAREQGRQDALAPTAASASGDLRALSEKATPGMMSVFEGQPCDHSDDGGGGFTACIGDLARVGSGRPSRRFAIADDTYPDIDAEVYSEARSNFDFISALWNAYRFGELVLARPTAPDTAPPAAAWEVEALEAVVPIGPNDRLAEPGWYVVDFGKGDHAFRTLLRVDDVHLEMNTYEDVTLVARVYPDRFQFVLTPKAEGAASRGGLDREAVRTIVARLHCHAEGLDPDDAISDAGHTVLDGLLGGLAKRELVRVDQATDAILALRPDPAPVVGEAVEADPQGRIADTLMLHLPVSRPLAVEAARWVFWVILYDGYVLPLERAKAALAALEARTGTGQTAAARDVLAERRRQVEAEGWKPEHDDQHGAGELALAASCYASRAHDKRKDDRPLLWPWSRPEWKPGDPRRMLIKAGALILAEIERWDRAAPPSPTSEGV